MLLAKRSYLLGKAICFMVANSPSTQVPCLNSTVFGPFAFPSLPAPAPAYRAFSSLYKDDINKPNTSVGHRDGTEDGGGDGVEGVIGVVD